MKSKELNFELYKKLYLIRKSEERICSDYFDDEMKTPVHLSIGQEAISAGVCSALGTENNIFGTYRSHGIYLTLSGETDKFFAELYGKETGLAKGKTGSMHLCAPELGFMGTSAIIGSIIPLAVGAAFANKEKKNKKIAAVFFGDGAIDEGVFWESLNLASLMKLPVIFICEDNDLAVHTSKEHRHGYNSIGDIVKQFNCNLLETESTDVEVVYNLTREAMGLIEKTGQPCFIHAKYYRYLEHVGICEDFDSGYRSKEDFEEWKKVDAIDMQRKKLLELGFSEKEIVALEAKIGLQIDKSVAAAKEAPFPGKERLYEDLYS